MLRIVAEGVERAHQADALRAAGVQLAQGYLAFRCPGSRVSISVSVNMRITERLKPDVAVKHFRGFRLQADGAASQTDPVAALVVPLL